MFQFVAIVVRVVRHAILARASDRSCARDAASLASDPVAANWGAVREALRFPFCLEVI